MSGDLAGSRNSLFWRIVIGTALAGLVFLAAFTHRLLLFALVAVFITLATLEFLKIIELRGIKLNPTQVLLFNLLFPVYAYCQWPMVSIVLVSFIVIATNGIFQKKSASYLGFASTSVFTLFYLGFLPSHLILLKHLVTKNSLVNWHVMFPLIITWINDTAAYGIGAGFGRHKLIPRISPKKSWEGTIAGLVFSIITALTYWWLWFRTKPFWYFLILGIILSFLALIGDLFESSFKREAGLKDSFQSLPGHGGFLDRIDSLLFTIPGFYYFLKIIGF